MAGKKILVVVDPTASEHPVVDRAAWLAKSCSGTLELFICGYDPDIIAVEESPLWTQQMQSAREHLAAAYREKLELLAAPLRKQGLEVAIDVALDRPLDDGIVRKVVKTKPWLVAKDTHHHNVLKRTILSNTDWGLIRECPVPLYLAKPQSLAKKPKIAAAVDPLHEHDKPAALDRKIVKVAEALADATGGELHVAHTYPLPQPMSIPEGAPIIDISEEVEAEHRKAFEAFVKKCKLPAARAHLLEGLPHLRLPDLVADINIDVMVMGAVSRRGLDRIFLGSTAERTLDRLPCDLLVVKPDGFETSVR